MVFPLPSAAWATAQDRVPIIKRPTEEHTDASAEPMPGKLQRLVERPLHQSEFLMPFSCLIGNSIFLRYLWQTHYHIETNIFFPKQEDQLLGRSLP
jgi:hypothetical protein